MLNNTHVLKQHYEPISLSDGTLGDTLWIGLSYHFTSLEKTGLAAMLAKLPLVSDAPIAMDIDLSCIVLDKSMQVVEKIWYGNLRNANESIRHQGDALVGAKSFEESLIAQEQMQLRLNELPNTAKHLLVVLNSYHNQPLRAADKGMIHLGDKDNPKVHSISFSQIEPDCKTLIAWQLSYEDNGWQLHTPMQALKLGKLASQSIDGISKAASDFLQNSNNNRW